MKDLERARLEPSRYQYLDHEESELYDAVKDSNDPKDRTIKLLLERIAKRNKSEHARELRR